MKASTGFSVLCAAMLAFAVWFSIHGLTVLLKPARAQSDGVALSIMAAQINALQTNWTVTVTARTNESK